MKALGAAGTTSKFQSAAPCISPPGRVGCSGGGVGGRRVGWESGEAAVALETTGDLKRQPPLLGAVVRLLILRGVAEQQQRQSGQLPPAPNRATGINRHGLVDLALVSRLSRGPRAVTSAGLKLKR